MDYNSKKAEDTSNKSRQDSSSLSNINSIALSEDNSYLITQHEILYHLIDMGFLDNTIQHIKLSQMSDGKLVYNGNNSWSYTPGHDFTGTLHCLCEVTLADRVHVVELDFDIEDYDEHDYNFNLSFNSSRDLLNEADFFYNDRIEFNTNVYNNTYEYSKVDYNIAVEEHLNFCSINSKDNEIISSNKIGYTIFQGDSLRFGAKELLSFCLAPDLKVSDFSVTDLQYLDNHGTLKARSTNSWEFHPDPEFIGTTLFSFTIADNELSVNCQIQLLIKPRTAVRIQKPKYMQDKQANFRAQEQTDHQEDKALAKPRVISVSADGATTISHNELVGASFDMEGAPIYVENLNCKHGSVTSTKSGAWLFKAKSGFSGETVINYEISDGKISIPNFLLVKVRKS